MNRRNAALTRCPVCSGELAVTRLYCGNCDTSIEGRFRVGAFGQLTAEQLAFVETFVRCEGKFTRMEAELGLSYPTLRNRLYEVIRALGHEPRSDEAPAAAAPERQAALDALERGEIDIDQALAQLQGGQ